MRSRRVHSSYGKAPARVNLPYLAIACSTSLPSNIFFVNFFLLKCLYFIFPYPMLNARRLFSLTLQFALQPLPTLPPPSLHRCPACPACAHQGPPAARHRLATSHELIEMWAHKTQEGGWIVFWQIFTRYWKQVKTLFAAAVCELRRDKNEQKLKDTRFLRGNTSSPTEVKNYDLPLVGFNHTSLTG